MYFDTFGVHFCWCRNTSWIPAELWVKEPEPSGNNVLESEEFEEGEESLVGS